MALINIQFKNSIKNSKETLSTKFVEVPLPVIGVEKLAGATMTTDSEAGQAYKQNVLVSVSSSIELDTMAANELLRCVFEW